MCSSVELEDLVFVWEGLVLIGSDRFLLGVNKKGTESVELVMLKDALSETKSK
jgi:hypothetical protein